MGIYIRFENGKQSEVSTLAEHPGEGWVEAPKNFSWDVQYRLDEKGNLKVMKAAEIAAEAMQKIRPRKKEEVKSQATQFRNQFKGIGQTKSEEYRFKADAARRIVELSKGKKPLPANNPDVEFLSFEAEAREMEVLELAKQIFQKNNESQLKLGIISAFEVKSLKLVDQATSEEKLQKELDALILETEKKLGIH